MIDQDTIWAQQLPDGPGKIGLRQDTYEIADTLVPAPFGGPPLKDLVIEGVGMQATRLLAMQQFRYNGLFGYGRPGYGPTLTRVVVRDLTIDGNYDGLGGEVPYEPDGGPGLVSLRPPFTSAYDRQAQTFQPYKHLFERVRFTRPPGYVIQPAMGVLFRDCIFDLCGQPNFGPTEATHFDIIGSGGWGDLWMENCGYINSSGNYVDLEGSPNEDGTPTQVRSTILNCWSENHQLGGLYFAGVESRAVNNIFKNTTPGGGCGYDTKTTVRSRNRFALNSLRNISYTTSGLSAQLHKDRMHDNHVS